jgi:hypothetical protein
MSRVRPWFGALLLTLGIGCADASGFHAELLPVDVRSDEPTARERLAACERDARVRSGLVAREVCADAVVFASEALDGDVTDRGERHQSRDALDRSGATGSRRVLPAMVQAQGVDFWFVISPNSRAGRPRATSGT